MKTSLIWVVCVSACVASPQPPIESTANAPSFESAKLMLEEIKSTGAKCFVPASSNHSYNSCPTQSNQYDRDACVAFDDAIQTVLDPIRACARLDPNAATREELAACDDYINHFLQPCTGVHALHLAYRERSQSQAYRDAVSNGVDEAIAKDRLLSELVRYRD